MPRTLSVTFWISTSHALSVSLFVSPPLRHHQPSQKTGISITNHKTVQCLHRHVHHYGLYIPGSTLRSLTTPLPGGISRISTTIDITIQRHRSDLRHKRNNHQFSQMGSPPLQEPPSTHRTAPLSTGSVVNGFPSRTAPLSTGSVVNGFPSRTAPLSLHHEQHHCQQVVWLMGFHHEQHHCQQVVWLMGLHHEQHHCQQVSTNSTTVNR